MLVLRFQLSDGQHRYGAIYDFPELAKITADQYAINELRFGERACGSHRLRMFWQQEKHTSSTRRDPSERAPNCTDFQFIQLQ